MRSAPPARAIAAEGKVAQQEDARSAAGRWPEAAPWLLGAALLVAACQSGESASPEQGAS